MWGGDTQHRAISARVGMRPWDAGWGALRTSVYAPTLHRPTHALKLVALGNSSCTAGQRTHHAYDSTLSVATPSLHPPPTPPPPPHTLRRVYYLTHAGYTPLHVSPPSTTQALIAHTARTRSHSARLAGYPTRASSTPSARLTPTYHPSIANPHCSNPHTTPRLVDYPTHAGYTPLHYAAAARAAAAAAALFRHGADPNARCGPGGFDWVLYPEGSTALHICAWRNCLDIAMMLLQYWVGRGGGGREGVG